MKLTQVLTGTGAAAAFLHAQTYGDSKGEAFGLITALSANLSLLCLTATIMIYCDLHLLEHDDMEAVEGYLLHYSSVLIIVIVVSVCSMMLLMVAILTVCYQAYLFRTFMICTIGTVGGFVLIVMFRIHSGLYLLQLNAQRTTTES